MWFELSEEVIKTVSYNFPAQFQRVYTTIFRIPPRAMEHYTHNRCGVEYIPVIS